jgi:hypothetical protein
MFLQNCCCSYKITKRTKRASRSGKRINKSIQIASRYKEVRENMASGCSNLKKIELNYAVPKMLLAAQ